MTEIETNTEITTPDTSSLTDVTPDSCISSCLSDGLSVAVGVVPALCILILLAAVGLSWYMTSYRKTLKDWVKHGSTGDPEKGPWSRIGPDGRSVWDELYGPYEAQEAMDMVNIFMLAHHRFGERKLPMYAIRGRELLSIEHAFNHLPADDRPWFIYEKIMADNTDRGDDDDPDISVTSVSSDSGIVPLHRVEGGTHIADIDPKFSEEEPSGFKVPKIPVSIKSHGDQADNIKSCDLSEKGGLSHLVDIRCLGNVPRPLQPAILPECDKEREFFITENMV